MVHSLILATLVISGCAGLTPQKRFPSFSEQIQHVKNVDIVMDVTILSDIEGSKLGINKENNVKTLEKMKQTLTTELKKRGYQPNFLFSSNGLLLEQPEEKQFFYSKDFSSTGEAFDQPMTENKNSDWLKEENKKFFTKAIKMAKAKNSSNRSKSKKAVKMTYADIPENVKALRSDLLVLVKGSVGEVGMDKTIGSSILTSVFTAVLTGGAYIYASAPVSASTMDIAIIDLKKPAVVWHNRTKGGDTATLNSALVSAITPLPTKSNEASGSLASASK